MAKKKDTSALFEVISKSREKRSEAGLSVPKWMGGGRAAEDQPAPTEAAPIPAGELPPSGPVICTGDGRLQLSLNYVTCMVIFLALVLLLAVAFTLGHYTAGPSPSEPASSLRDATGPGTTNSVDATTGPKRIRGLYYLLIQRFAGTSDTDRADAEHIVDFCAKRNIAAEIQAFNAGDGTRFLGVWSLKGFKDRNSDSAKDFALEIEELGQKYFQTRGKYTFLQRSRPDSPLNADYVPYTH